jgi:hypothetical protein
MVGLVALVTALAMTGALSILRVDEVVEVFPLPPDVLDLPLPTGLAPQIVAPASTPAPTVVGSLGETGQPTTAILQSGRDHYSGCSDTYIQFYRPTANYCESPELYLVTSNKAATLLRFDLTELPDSIIGLNSDAVILEATLELYAVQGNKDVVMGIYLPYGPWDPCAVTWNTPWEGPGADGLSDREHDPRVEATAQQATGWMEFNVTGLVQHWLRDPGQNYGMIIKSFDVSAPSHHIFFSSDHPGEDGRPKLTIRYEPALPTPTPTVTPTSTPTPATTATPTFTPTTAPTAAPTATPAATPTLILPLSPRVVEVHWRNEMDLGGSYPVQVIFRPETAQAMSSLVRLYMLSVHAQVTAPTFDVVENSAAEQMLEQPEDILSWSWQVEPQVVGSQAFSLDLLFDWRPATSGAPVIRAEPGAWYQTKVIKIITPFRYWPQLALLRNLLVSGGLACLVGWYMLRRRTIGRSLGD